MGQNISSHLFHFTYGVSGFGLVLRNFVTNNIIKSTVISGLTLAAIRIAFKEVKVEISKNKVVFITGCDSGLGFSFAVHAQSLGFTVIAGCLNLNSDGAKVLMRNFENIHVIEVDITVQEYVEKTVQYLEDFFRDHPDCVLHALVNNAGIMVFGEFEWHTENHILQQLAVNTTGTMRMTRATLPFLRKYAGRIITVTSHCAEQSLPGLSVYGASKAALVAWSDSLRVELFNHGVQVTSFLPGSLVYHTNIMSRINIQAEEMKNAMTQQQWEYYDDYFQKYYSYLGKMASDKLPTKIDERDFYNVFECALLDKNSKRSYKHEPWRYTFYHTLAKISPTRLRDYFIVKFVKMPEWKPKLADS